MRIIEYGVFSEKRRLEHLLFSIKKQFIIDDLQVWIGLLRFHLSLPASPLDPGKKPAAKVVQWDQHLRDLGSKLVTIRMEAGLVLQGTLNLTTITMR